MRCDFCGREIEAWNIKHIAREELRERARGASAALNTTNGASAYEVCPDCQRGDEIAIPITIVIPEDAGEFPKWAMTALQERWHSITGFDVVRVWISKHSIKLLLVDGKVIEESLEAC